MGYLDKEQKILQALKEDNYAMFDGDKEEAFEEAISNGAKFQNNK